MSSVIIFPRGQLSEVDRTRRADAGIIAVEADNPEQVVVTAPGVPLAGADDLMLAALTAVVKCGYPPASTEFTKALHKRLLAKKYEQLNSLPREELEARLKELKGS